MQKAFQLERIDGHEVYTLLSSDDEDEGSEVSVKLPSSTQVESRPHGPISTSASLESEIQKCWACDIQLDQKLIIEKGDEDENDQESAENSTYLYSTHGHPLLR